MARAKLVGLARVWYTFFVVLTHLILVYCGIKQCYFNDRLPWPKTFPIPKLELLLQKICLLISLVLLFIFIYPAMFVIGNMSNDNRQLSIDDFHKNTKKNKSSLCSSLWYHSFSLSSTLHLIMSFLVIISTLLIDAKQIMVGLKDPAFLWRTDIDLLFDWSSSPSNSPMSAIAKRFAISNSNAALASALPFSIEAYSRFSLLNFFVASFICTIREPKVFWSISKAFSFLYSFAVALNVIQWCLMYGAFQLLLKNICFNYIDSIGNSGFLLVHQPYTTFFLYLLLEFLVFISSVTLYYYAYCRFKTQQKHISIRQSSSCWDRCSHYCPSLIAIIILLLYTACKMPLVHDIFLLYIQTRLRLLFITFIFEIVHVLLMLALWIFLTTKIDWNLKQTSKQQLQTTTRLNIVQSPPSVSTPNGGISVKSSPPPPSAVSLPELSGDCSSTIKTANHRPLSDNLYQKPYEKIRIFQSEIYYRNHERPKNWSLPLNQHPNMMAAFDNDDEDNDIVVRSPSYPTTPNMNTTNNNEIQYRNAIRKTVSNLYKFPTTTSNAIEQKPKAVFLQSSTPPMPPVKRFTPEQVKAARLRAQQLTAQQQSQRIPETYMQHHRSAALLISQV